MFVSLEQVMVWLQAQHPATELAPTIC
jgi:hypothetical protein